MDLITVALYKKERKWGRERDGFEGREREREKQKETEA